MKRDELEASIAKWERWQSSALAYIASGNYNLFSYCAAKQTAMVCDARIELAEKYRARMA